MEVFGAAGRILLELLYQTSQTWWDLGRTHGSPERSFHSRLWIVWGSLRRSWILWLDIEKSELAIVARCACDHEWTHSSAWKCVISLQNKYKPRHAFSYIRSLNYFISDFIIKIFTKRFLSDNNILKVETEVCIWRGKKVSDLLTDKKGQKQQQTKLKDWKWCSAYLHLAEKEKKNIYISSTSDQTKPGKWFFTEINERSRVQYL